MHPKLRMTAAGLSVALLCLTCRPFHSRPTLTASPNPVPAAGAGPGTTTITWNTGVNSSGQVYVSLDGKPERLFATRPSGFKEARWISHGVTYEFRLYEGTDHKKLLATVRVTRERANHGR